MLLGHYGVALAAKKYSPKTSLWILITAANFLDLLWPMFLLAGWEKVKIAVGITKITPLDFSYYPFSHSLLAVIIWSLVFGLIYYSFTKYKAGALVLGGLVLSHWVLDLLVHKPDLPLSIWGDQKVGLGIWNIPILTFILELGILLVGIHIYRGFLTNLKRWQKNLYYFLISFLVLIYFLNVFGPAPTSVKAIAIVGNSVWLLVLAAYFIEKPNSLPAEQN